MIILGLSAEQVLFLLVFFFRCIMHVNWIAEHQLLKMRVYACDYMYNTTIYSCH